jgi:hypothetical protein
MKTKRVEHPQGLIDVAPKRQVVNDRVSNDAFAVDEEETAESDGIVQKHAVTLCNALIEICD